MKEVIEQLIKAGKYHKALDLVENEIEALGSESISEEHEQMFRELIGYRVTAKTLSGGSDVVVSDHVHKTVFGSKHAFQIEGGKEIRLLFGNLFSQQCDAYVNSIHAERHFHYSGRSASTSFVNELGDEFIKSQLQQQQGSDKNYVMLEHPQLKAPCSFQIPCCQSDENLDREALRDGLWDVLSEAAKRRMKRLGFVALGFETLKDNAQRSELANFVAETLMEFLLGKSGKNAPDLLFCAITVGSYQALDRAFYHFSQLDKRYLEEKKKLKRMESIFVSEVKTIDSAYTKTLGEISRSLDEDNIILLRGETGVGKSFVAKLIHDHGNRTKQPFVSWNCAMGRPENMHASLFGWKRGSFTGAKDNGVGLVEEAEGGVLFLDEVGYAPIEVQKALLTFLDSKKYRRYGDSKESKADVKLVFGTNQDLELYVFKTFRTIRYV